jgi:isoamyl acetate esterase
MKIGLIGDSIRLNAQPFLRERLPAEFELRAPAENCESSQRVAASIREWLPIGAVGVVHINCGLHDIRYDPGLDRPVSSPEVYEANLRDIFAYLAATGAMVIWATSTPIDEARHNANKLSRRYRAHLLDYNRRSVQIARDFGFAIHDLYARVAQAGVADLLLPDGVHFNREGNALIGVAIAEAIMAAVHAKTQAMSVTNRDATTDATTSETPS